LQESFTEKLNKFIFEAVETLEKGNLKDLIEKDIKIIQDFINNPSL